MRYASDNMQAVRKSTKPLHPYAATSVELPTSAEQLAPAAAELLGWRGLMMPPVSLLGREVSVIAKVLPEAHAERLCLGLTPVMDQTSVATWAWPELAHTAPPTAVRISGMISVTKHWRTGLASTVPFVSYGRTAMVLPIAVALTDDYLTNCLPRARQFGVSIVLADTDCTLTVDFIGQRQERTCELDSVGRWINEVVYEQVLSLGQ